MFDSFLKKHSTLSILSEKPYTPFPRKEERIAWDNAHRDEICAWGDTAKQGYPMLTATDFLAFVRPEKSRKYEKSYFERRQKLMGAILAECVTNDGQYLDAIVDGLWCICEESTWVVSAHNGSVHEGVPPPEERALPDIHNPYIDLFSAQTAATLSFALYFHSEALDEISPLICKRVREEIDKRIFKPFLYHDDFWWMGIVRKDVNNWTPWILSNVLTTFLLVSTDRFEKARAITRSCQMLDRFLAIMPEDGGCDEGSGYWNLSGASLFDCLEILWDATDGKLDFFAEPQIKAIGHFPVLAHIDGPYYWNFADCDACPHLSGERMIAYGRRTNDDALISLGYEEVMRHPSIVSCDTPQMNRVLHAIFFKKRAEEVQPLSHSTSQMIESLGIHTFEKKGLYTAIKAGNNGENHNHNDIGQFVIYLDGEPHIIDVGNVTYTANTFSELRYTQWNTRSMYHNVAIIGDMEQAPGKEYSGEIITYNEKMVKISLAKAYPSSEITQYIRTCDVSDGVHLTDEIVLTQAQPITWVFMSRLKPIVMQAGTLRIGKMKMTYDVKLELETEEIPVVDARLARNFPGSVWRISLTEQPGEIHQQSFIFERSE